MPSARDPEAVYRAFGRKLREIRQRKRVPQQELATFSGLTRSSIANIESGKQRVLLHQVLLFAWALDATVDELMPSSAKTPHILPEILRAPEAESERQAYLEKVRKLASSAPNRSVPNEHGT